MKPKLTLEGSGGDPPKAGAAVLVSFLAISAVSGHHDGNCAFYSLRIEQKSPNAFCAAIVKEPVHGHHDPETPNERRQVTATAAASSTATLIGGRITRGG